MQDFIRDITETPGIVEYKLMSDIFENELRKSNMTDDYIKNAKKNLRRKTERISQMSFLFMLDASFISIYLFENKLELNNLKSKSNSEKGILSTALMIREKIKTLKDTMPWSPNPHNLLTCIKNKYR